MRKLTFLIALLVCSIGFSQSALSDLGVDSNTVMVEQGTTNQNIPIVDNSNSDLLSNLPVGYEDAPQQRFTPNQTLLVNSVDASNYLTGIFNYTEYANNANFQQVPAISSDRPTVVINPNRSSGVVDTYTDLATWQANVAGGLVSEDFSGGPGGIVACDPVISSAGDANCYPPGELEEGFDIQASNATLVVYIESGAIGNTSDLVGANTFVEFTIINFTGPDPVFEVGHDIWNNSDVDTDYRVYDTGGALLQTFTLNNAIQTENFFGIISPMAIGHVEIEGANGSGELLGNLKFTAPGGGGGGPCNQMTVTPAGGVENGRGCSANNNWTVANDFIVSAGEDAEISSIVANILVAPGATILSADVGLWDDAAGLPGTNLDTQLAVVPTSQPVIGSAFGLDILAVTLDVAPLAMAGDAGMDVSYWISLQVTTSDGGSAFWEDQSLDVIGEFLAFENNGAGWAIPATRDGVYTYVADCTPIGGGGGPCDQMTVTPAGGVENGRGCSANNNWTVANDFIVPTGEDAEVSSIVANILVAPGATILSADVGLWDDAAGLPGTNLDTQLAVVPTSQPVIGSAFGLDILAVTLDVAPLAMAGDAGMDVSYWISLQVTTSDGGSAFWEDQSLDVIGEFLAFENNGAGWTIPATRDGVYTYVANCTPIGGGPVCVNTTFVAGGLPADIDPGGTSTTDCAGAPNDYPVTVGDPGTIGVDSNIDNVTLTITHTFDGDLDIWLVSPAGTELILSDQNGGGGDNFIDTVFMDGAGPLSGGAPPYTGTFEPDGGTFAAAFDGEDIQGDWLLRICDRFGGDTGTVDAFSISICRPDPPTNDECVDAFPVACGDVVVGETITDTDSGGNPAPDEWYSFTGSGTPQVVTVSLCDGGTDYDSFLRVFDACGGTEIAANDDSCGLQSELSFLSDGTSTYYIMVEGFASNSGNFSMAITCVDPPPNDECAGAISMDCGDTVVGETNTATFDASAPVCVTGITAPGVWYEFTDTTGLVTNYTLSMCDGGTDYDSKITVYSGDCGALACVVDNDDTCGLQSEVSWQGDGSTTYYILVHGFGSATGNFSMALTCAPVPPPNDMIVNSIDVDEIGFPYTDPAVAMPAATTENGNPAGCNLDGANGVWYNFVPDGDGFATAEIITPGGASAVTFYSAPDENSTETDLTLVDWNGNQCVPGTSAIIPTVAGQAYYVFVLNSGAITDIVIDGNNLGVNDNAIQGFTYHPNPTDGVLNLNSVENIDSVAIYNILGQQVLNQTIDATSTQLDVSNLAVGAYVMKVSVNGETGTYKIIKR